MYKYIRYLHYVIPSPCLDMSRCARFWGHWPLPCIPTRLDFVLLLTHDKVQRITLVLDYSMGPPTTNAYDSYQQA